MEADRWDPSVVAAVVSAAIDEWKVERPGITQGSLAGKIARDCGLSQGTIASELSNLRGADSRTIRRWTAPGDPRLAALGKCLGLGPGELEARFERGVSAVPMAPGPWHPAFPDLPAGAVFIEPPMRASVRLDRQRWFEPDPARAIEGGTAEVVRYLKEHPTAWTWLVGPEGAGRRTLGRALLGELGGAEGAFVESTPTEGWARSRRRSAERRMAVLERLPIEAPSAGDVVIDLGPWGPAELEGVAKVLGHLDPLTLGAAGADRVRQFAGRCRADPGLLRPLPRPADLIHLLRSAAEEGRPTDAGQAVAAWTAGRFRAAAREAPVLAALGESVVEALFAPSLASGPLAGFGTFRAERAAGWLAAAVAGIPRPDDRRAEKERLLTEVRTARGKARDDAIDGLERLLRADPGTAVVEALIEGGILRPAAPGDVSAVDRELALAWACRGVARGEATLDLRGREDELCEPGWVCLAGDLGEAGLSVDAFLHALDGANGLHPADRSLLLASFLARAPGDVVAPEILVPAWADTAWSAIHRVLDLGPWVPVDTDPWANPAAVVRRLSDRYSLDLPRLEGPDFAASLAACVSPAVRTLGAAHQPVPAPAAPDEDLSPSVPVVFDPGDFSPRVGLPRKRWTSALQPARQLARLSPFQCVPRDFATAAAWMDHSDPDPLLWEVLERAAQGGDEVTAALLALDEAAWGTREVHLFGASLDRAPEGRARWLRWIGKGGGRGEAALDRLEIPSRRSGKREETARPEPPSGSDTDGALFDALGRLDRDAVRARLAGVLVVDSGYVPRWIAAPPSEDDTDGGTGRRGLGLQPRPLDTAVAFALHAAEHLREVDLLRVVAATGGEALDPSALLVAGACQALAAAVRLSASGARARTEPVAAAASRLLDREETALRARLALARVGEPGPLLSSLREGLAGRPGDDALEHAAALVGLAALVGFQDDEIGPGPGPAGDVPWVLAARDDMVRSALAAWRWGEAPSRPDWTDDPDCAAVLGTPRFRDLLAALLDAGTERTRDRAALALAGGAPRGVLEPAATEAFRRIVRALDGGDVWRSMKDERPPLSEVSWRGLLAAVSADRGLLARAVEAAARGDVEADLPSLAVSLGKCPEATPLVRRLASLEGDPKRALHWALVLHEREPFDPLVVAALRDWLLRDPEPFAPAEATAVRSFVHGALGDAGRCLALLPDPARVPADLHEAVRDALPRLFDRAWADLLGRPGLALVSGDRPPFPLDSLCRLLRAWGLGDLVAACYRHPPERPDLDVDRDSGGRPVPWEERVRGWLRAEWLLAESTEALLDELRRWDGGPGPEDVRVELVMRGRVEDVVAWARAVLEDGRPPWASGESPDADRRWVAANALYFHTPDRLPAVLRRWAEADPAGRDEVLDLAWTYACQDPGRFPGLRAWVRGERARRAPG